MSDGRNERLASTGNDDHQRDSRILSGGNRDGSDTSAPVATSVSARDFHRNSCGIAIPLYAIVRDGIPSKPIQEEILDAIYEFAEAYAREYASSSSAALLVANEVIRRQLKKVCDQVAALEEENATWLQTVKLNVEYRVAAEDSRNRLQEALRAAANHLHYVGQEQAAGQARAALNPVPDTE